MAVSGAEPVGVAKEVEAAAMARTAEEAKEEEAMEMGEAEMAEETVAAAAAA